MRLLKIAGRYTVPERPIFAFLGSTDSSGDLGEIRELRYNIEDRVPHYNIEVMRI